MAVLASCVAPRPNVVLFVADDMGWGDLGVQGAQGYSTPNLDRLAREGMRFTNFYVAQPVCSASRAAILTGCYPNRIGIAGALAPSNKHGIAASETTIAELAKTRGYSTAIFGKWHLGHLPPFRPMRHGFDVWRGLPYSNDMWPGHPQTPKAWPDLPFFDGDSVVALNPDPASLTHDATVHALEFVRERASKSEPFFLYMPYSMPHVPIGALAPFRGRTLHGLYGDVLEELDASVGSILDELERLHLADNTLVLFTSDNGPWLPYGDHAGSAGPLRLGKGTTFEGGVREPFLVRWPHHVPANTTCSEPVMTIDLLPTIANAIGAELPQLPIDGLDITPLFEARPDARTPHEALFFWYEQNELQAVRSGPWKLHFPHSYGDMTGVEGGHGGQPAKYPVHRTGLELYDLEHDIGEQHDVAAQHPDVVARLTQLADAKRAELGDKLTKTKGSANRKPDRADEQSVLIED